MRRSYRLLSNSSVRCNYARVDPILQSLPRGIAPALLLRNVSTTAPYWLEGANDLAPKYVHTLRSQNSQGTLSHADYFRLCLSAHFATVATFVPTDVDNTIRFKLWQTGMESIDSMARIVLEAYHWDTRPVSTRWVDSPWGLVSGHQGEWFSVAVAAYNAVENRMPALATELLQLIHSEVEREASVFQYYLEKKDGCNLLRVSTILAHNLGDLDRVIDMWDMDPLHPFRKEFYKLGHSSTGGFHYVAGEMNKRFMAIDNHRHLPLREPRAIRKFRDLLLPISPFLDDWGRSVATHPGLTEKDVGEVASALVRGFEKLNCPGYARALQGIEENFRGGDLRSLLPAREYRALKSGDLRKHCSIPKEQFEASLSASALRWASSIPINGIPYTQPVPCKGPGSS